MNIEFKMLSPLHPHHVLPLDNKICLLGFYSEEETVHTFAINLCSVKVYFAELLQPLVKLLIYNQNKISSQTLS